MLRTTALLAPFLLLGVNGQHDGHDHGGSHAGHDHGSSSSSSVTTHEWAGIFPVSGTTQVWRAQKVNGAYADPMMGMVIVPATESSESMLTSLVPESATGFATTCTVVHNGETITPRTGVCYTLEFGSGSESTYTIDTTGVSHVAIFAEHFPTEFESDRHYLQDAADADVEPIATIPFTPGLAPPPDLDLTPIIVGAVAGVIVLLILIVVLAVICYMKSKSSAVHQQQELVQPQVQMAAPAGPAPKFDPATGQPLARTSMKFDPQTGQPLPVAPVDGQSVAPSGGSGKVPRLMELKELLDGGVLTQEEFDAQKKAILQA